MNVADALLLGGVFMSGVIFSYVTIYAALWFTHR